MSWCQLLYHIVFSTKRRENTISSNKETELYKYIWGILKRLDCHLYRINGMTDHIHIFVSIPSKYALADVVKAVKQGSSIWLFKNPNFPKWNGWEEGYGALTYSWRDKDMIVNYIKQQKEHHKHFCFIDEYKVFLHDMGFDDNKINAILHRGES